MKTIAIIASTVIATLAVVFAVQKIYVPTPPKAQAAAVSDKPARKIKYYWDPMLGPSSVSDKPGKSAMNMDLVPVYEDDATNAADASQPGEVTIDSSIVQNVGIRTAQVTRGPLTKSIRTVGILRIPEPAQHDVSLKINGWIETLYADHEGMHIQRGEPLFAIYSPDLQVAEEELISAQRSLKSLDAATSPQLRSETQSLVESAKRKLSLWDVADQDIETIANSDSAPRTVIFRSPATGDVMDKMVVAGSSVQAGMKLMSIEDHSKLWLDAVVYEDSMSMIALGQQVSATTESFPGITFKGTISFIYPHVDPATRTITVRAVLDHSEGGLRPGMYMTADILTQPVQDAVLAPREAIIDTGTRQIAFVVRSAGHFDPVEVRMGVVGDGEQAQILSGLKPGDTVVTSGQFLLDVESRTSEAIEKLMQPQQGGAKP
jgi:Cu(I)/Ag(I) efflux system membrane fusion protein